MVQEMKTVIIDFQYGNKVDERFTRVVRIPEKDWGKEKEVVGKCYEKAKKNDPDEWSADDYLILLEGRGWEVEETETVEVWVP